MPSECESESESLSDDDIPLAKLPPLKKNHKPSLGDIVEVLWMGEGQWFEGEIIDLREGDEYRVHYKFDGQKLWHDQSSRVRLKL